MDTSKMAEVVVIGVLGEYDADKEYTLSGATIRKIGQTAVRVAEALAPAPGTLLTKDVILHYTCTYTDEHESGEETTADQPLADIVTVGTLICEECGADMVLDSDVSIVPDLTPGN